MRGVAKQRKIATTLGQAWCDKGFHFTTVVSGRYVTWFDPLGEPASEPCRHCVREFEESGVPITIGT